jgi:putative spermidine/putrescine transport system ATP-binding protein
MAVDGLNCAVERGEFLTFLGPSGSGKTTALMMLAGFEQPSAGELRLNGRSLAHVPPHHRNMGVVFQNYALFPHMSVAENLSFPLGVRKVPAHTVRERVQQVLALVRLEGYENRRPVELSGGQQQRVALARALIFGPELILMDEPLGALDKQLREQLQTEIKQIHRHLGVTVVYVTHDQSEALTLSDRIALFEGGSIRQLGAPHDLYERPASAFVAQFIGQNNRLDGVVEGIERGLCIVQLAGGARLRARPIDAAAPGESVTAWVRPEHIEIGPGATFGNELSGRIHEIVYQGDHLRVRVALAAGAEIVVKCARAAGERLQRGATTRIAFKPDDCHAFAGAGPAGTQSGYS